MSGIICKTRSREKRQCEPEEGKRKQNRNICTHADYMNWIKIAGRTSVYGKRSKIKELQHIYGNWIKFPTDKDTEYEITAQDCTITFAYLSECEII